MYVLCCGNVIENDCGEFDSNFGKQQKTGEKLKFKNKAKMLLRFNIRT